MISGAARPQRQSPEAECTCLVFVFFFVFVVAQSGREALCAFRFVLTDVGLFFGERVRMTAITDIFFLSGFFSFFFAGVESAAQAVTLGARALCSVLNKAVVKNA